MELMRIQQGIDCSLKKGRFLISVSGRTDKEMRLSLSVFRAAQIIQAGRRRHFS